MVRFSLLRTALMASGREAVLSQASRRMRLTAGGSSESGRFGNTCHDRPQRFSRQRSLGDTCRTPTDPGYTLRWHVGAE